MRLGNNNKRKRKKNVVNTMEEELRSLERNEQRIKAIAQWRSKSVISITTSKKKATD